jgi:hypothetical protein
VLLQQRLEGLAELAEGWEIPDVLAGYGACCGGCEGFVGELLGKRWSEHGEAQLDLVFAEAADVKRREICEPVVNDCWVSHGHPPRL